MRTYLYIGGWVAAGFDASGAYLLTVLAATDRLDRGELQEYASNTDMRTLKVIFGSVCLIAALPLALFAWECFLASNYAGEDTIEMKDKIPEIEEEDQYNGWIDQLGGTWTNENLETMTISNNGTFSTAIPQEFKKKWLEI